jgi:hypothetical protein
MIGPVSVKPRAMTTVSRSRLASRASWTIKSTLRCIGMAFAALALCLQILLPSVHLAMLPGSSTDSHSDSLALAEHAICRSTDSGDATSETPGDESPSQGKHACGVLCWCPWGASFVLPAPTSVLRVASPPVRCRFQRTGIRHHPGPFIGCCRSPRSPLTRLELLRLTGRHRPRADAFRSPALPALGKSSSVRRSSPCPPGPGARPQRCAHMHRIRFRTRPRLCRVSLLPGNDRRRRPLCRR